VEKKERKKNSKMKETKIIFYFYYVLKIVEKSIFEGQKKRKEEINEKYKTKGQK
jgi:hypothetical protein